MRPMRTLTLTVAFALLAFLPVPAASAPAPQDCHSNQPIKADELRYWTIQDQGGSVVAGVRNDVQEQWELVSNDCELLSLYFACDAVSEIDPGFPLFGCHSFLGLVHTTAYDGARPVFGATEDTILTGKPVCEFTADFQGPGPWSCGSQPLERPLPVDDIPRPL